MLMKDVGRGALYTVGARAGEPARQASRMELVSQHWIVTKGSRGGGLLMTDGCCADQRIGCEW